MRQGPREYPARCPARAAAPRGERQTEQEGPPRAARRDRAGSEGQGASSGLVADGSLGPRTLFPYEPIRQPH